MEYQGFNSEEQLLVQDDCGDVEFVNLGDERQPYSHYPYPRPRPYYPYYYYPRPRPYYPYYPPYYYPYPHYPWHGYGGGY
ncbi:hypothetical protein [Priestia megaterium]|uniref:hypothetical protein n=1 Tax=Priestia megaterium TaxID=1404 RepID=UPI001B3B3881|nr:hypothetical protein [Priestia megaterium]